jgi:hypothetical protein
MAGYFHMLCPPRGWSPVANAIVHGVYLTMATVLLCAFGNAAVAQTLANASMALTSGKTSEQFGTYSTSGTYAPAERI